MSQNHGRNSHQKRELKDRLFRGKQQRRCCFCQRMLNRCEATLEHIIPLSKGGNWHITNLDISCKKCNQKRGNLDFNLFTSLVGVTL